MQAAHQNSQYLKHGFKILSVHPTPKYMKYMYLHCSEECSKWSTPFTDIHIPYLALVTRPQLYCFTTIFKHFIPVGFQYLISDNWNPTETPLENRYKQLVKTLHFILKFNHSETVLNVFIYVVLPGWVLLWLNLDFEYGLTRKQSVLSCKIFPNLEFQDLWFSVM